MTPDDLRLYNQGVALARYSYRHEPFALSRYLTTREIAWLHHSGRISDHEADLMRAEVRRWEA